ncbi:MAG: molybdenum cofactor guanylyltransferase [Nitrospirota bacterium]|jgi:molybdopterin-guanine dinucleotide biosynthesis protein A
MTGVLLAGGKSRRMGRDKRFLELEGRTLLERALSVLESLFSEVIVVVAEPVLRLSGLRHQVVTDLVPNCATLGGLYTGLSSAAHGRIFAAACDMPFLNQSVIKWMAKLDRNADVVMAQLANGLQPMHAVYSKACLPHLERMLNARNLKVQELSQTPGLSVRLVSEDELREADPQFLSFLNINTVADLEFARKLLAGKRTNLGGES